MSAAGRHPVRDRVAIVGLGTTGYTRDASDHSATDLAAEAARTAVRDAGLRPDDVDGICGSIVPTKVLQAALGLPAVTWWADVTPPFGIHVVEAVNAVFAGACTTALVYHANYRGPHASRSAAADPFRRRNDGLDAHAGERRPEEPTGPTGYAGWADRYLQTYGVGREVFGHIAMNSRANAARNPHAIYRSPMTMEDYLGARMVREPLGLYDMDVPVDGADALMITTAERATDLTDTPVFVHATTAGRTRWPFADQPPDYTTTGKEIVAGALWARSDLAREDMDLFYPYEGFSNIAVGWFEALGFCSPGEAADYLADQWDDDAGRLRLNGRVEVNTHGGSLSEGGTQGTGHVREAVEQLRGLAGERQVAGARAALIGSGGFLWNALGLVLRTD